MRRLTVLALLTVAAVVYAGSITETFRFSADAVQIGTANGYATVDYLGAAHPGRLGQPDLPAQPCQVLIPADAEVTGIEIVKLVQQPVPGSHLLLPVQHPTPWRADAKPMPFVEPDHSIYDADAFWPTQPAVLTQVGNKAGFRIAGFLVYPVRFNPVTRQLVVSTEVTVRVSYATGRRHVPRRTEMQNLVHGAAVSKLVLNPGDINRFAPPTRSASYGSQFLPPGDYEHVILTASQYVDSLKWLRDWRTKLGWRSKIVVLESIIATYPGRDNPEKMRNFIKDADTTWGVIFVFIARPDYPAPYYRVARVYGYDFYTDHYFSDLDGDWDRNGNNIFGENADSIDGYADVHVGMMTVDNFAEIRNVRNKVERYETRPDTTGNWWNKNLLPNGVTFSNEFNDSIANASPTPPWFDMKMYMSGGMVQPTPQRYCDSLNSGYTFTSVIAHGSPDLYDLNGYVTSPMMNALTNADRLNCITAVCCNVAEWNLGSTNNDCIAENMLNHAPNGFIGVMMNYESGWVRCAEFFNYATGYALLGFRTPRKVTQGEMMSYARDYWVPVMLDSQKFRMEMMERTLFGEPAVPIWTDKPFSPVVTRPGAINIGNNIPVPITVTDGAFAPVDSAMVVLQKGTETFARGWTNASGQVTLYVSCLTPGFLNIAISGANNLPYVDSIIVMASGRYVSYLRHSVNDSAPGGNGDGIINPGESFRIPTWVKNYGTLTADAVVGRMRTHAAGVTITDSVKSFGSIAGGDSALNAQGFGMTVAGGLPNGYPIPCSLICKDQLDTTWVSYVTFYVGAPAIGYVAKAVKDSAGSQPNGRLDPNETADLEVTIRNSGLGNAYNVTAVLRSTDVRLTVPDPVAVYGTILRDSAKTNYADHFTLHAAASILPETPIACTLEITADNGYSSKVGFTIVVGEIRATDPMPDGPRTPPLYWAYDEVDSTYGEHPDFNWVEIRGLGTRLTLTDDQTTQINLPTGFGPFVYYGQSYTQVSICGNGWIAPGYSTLTTYSNTTLPNSSMPPALFVNWDDIYPPTGGGVWYYHDATNHRFIIEWDSVHYYSPREQWDKYQVILYDTTLAAEDGNCEFVLQYLTANQPGNSATLGIQDPTLAICIQLLADGSYTRGASPWVAGHAVKFTTDSPTGIAEPAEATLLGLDRVLAVTPSLFCNTARIHWLLARAGNAEVTVFDASGRAVRTIASGQQPAGRHSAVWNGTDDSGRELAHGVYFIRLTTPDKTAKVKTVLAR